MPPALEAVDTGRSIHRHAQAGRAARVAEPNMRLNFSTGRLIRRRLLFDLRVQQRLEVESEPVAAGNSTRNQAQIFYLRLPATTTPARLNAEEHGGAAGFFRSRLSARSHEMRLAHLPA